MIKVAIFTGNEGVGPDHIEEIPEWSKEAVLAKLIEDYRDWASDEYIDEGEEKDMYPIRTTLEEAIPGRMYQGQKDAINGGMIYVVKVD